METHQASVILSPAEILETVSAIALQIQQCQGLEDILHGAIATVRSQLHADRVLIYQFLPNHDAVVSFESIIHPWIPILGRLIDDPCFDAIWIERYQQGQITSMTDAHDGTVDPCYVALLDQLQVQANLVAPIFQHATLWGLMIVHQCSHPRQWEPVEFTLVQQVSLQLSIALQTLERSHQTLMDCSCSLHTSHANTLQPVSLPTVAWLESRSLQVQGDRPLAYPSDADQATNFRLMADSVPFLVWVSDAEGRGIFFNQAWLAFKGRSLQQELGNGWSQGIHPDDWSRCWQTYQHALETQQAFRLEYRLQRADGEYRWILEQGTAYCSPTGAFTGFIGSCLDISERKQNEETLRRYERIISATPDCVSLLDRNYVYQVVNQTYLTWNQKSYDEIVGHSVSELLGQEFFETYCKPMLDRCLAGETQCVVDSWLNYGDGERRFVRATYAPYVEMDGTISGVVINVHDLTQLKHTEEALRESETRWQFALEGSGDGVWDWDIANGGMFFSRQWKAMLGYEEDEISNCLSAWESRIHPEDKAQCWADHQAHFRGETAIYQNEHRLRCKDGSYKWIFDRGKVIQWGEGGLPLRMIGIHTDISDRKHAELALQFSQAKFEALVTNMPGMVYRYFPTTPSEPHRFTFVSAHSMELLELAPDVLLHDADALLDLIHPDDLASFLASVTYAVAHFLPWHWEGRITTPSGKQKWIQGNSQAQHAPEGEAWDGLLVDISDRKQAELQLQQQIEREKLLTAIAQHIRQTLDLNQILQTTVTEVRQFLQTDRVIIYRFETDWSGVVIAESVGADWLSILGMQITDSYFVETQGKTYEQERIKATDDIYQANFDPCHVELLENMQVRAKLVVPILQDQHLWGLLVAQHCRSPRHWDHDEIELQRQLATQIAIALQQSELYQQVQALNTGLELQVAERTAQLQQALEFEALLKRITDHVRDSLDEQKILQATVEELVQGLNINACDTGIYNADHTTSTIAYEFTKNLSKAQGVTFDIAQAPHNEVYPMLFGGDVCQFCDVSPNPLRSEQYLLTILAVPIRDDRGVLGDLWLFKQPHQWFNDQEVRLAQQVANQCAIALRQSRLYQAAQAQVQVLERLNLLKDDFLSTVSHELRSPMANIKMATQVLEISLEPLGILSDETKATYRYFKILKEECQREIELINDLLDLTRLDAGTEPLNLSTIALQVFLPHIAEPLTERTRRQQQQLILDIADNLPPLRTDLSYLERILTELLHNACKYTPAGESITLAAHPIETDVQISVCNSGVEIPTTECDRIFDKFYRIPHNDPWKYGGTGLGLALVKKLVQQINGTIHVESHQGKTCFVMRLPGDIEAFKPFSM